MRRYVRFRTVGDGQTTRLISLDTQTDTMQITYAEFQIVGSKYPIDFEYAEISKYYVAWYMRLWLTSGDHIVPGWE